MSGERSAISNERILAEFVCDARLEDFSDNARGVVRQIVLAVLGAGMAGASEDGCREIRKYVLEMGGRAEATVFFSSAKAPAHAAALANGLVCRALDYCDAMAPGLHIGSSIVPVALALAERRGGCSGRDFLAALAVGAEIGARFNLSEAEYHGFDPTGVAGVFAATATACRMLKLDSRKTLHALALAFNRAGGSFQSNVDGSLAVRLIQGWVAESGIICADLAERGITGPANFLDGIYGYRRLFATNSGSDHFTRNLGQEFRLERAVFKQFPSCGVTQGVTQLVLEAMKKHGVTADKATSIAVRLPPYAHKLVGHPFTVGDNPRVNAQFSAQYCVANALLRGASQLGHFRPEAVADSAIGALARTINVQADPKLDARGHTAVDLDITLSSGQSLSFTLDHPDGFPDSPLTPAAQTRRFEDCLRYSPLSDAQERGAAVLRMVEELAGLDDVRPLVEQLAAG